MTLDTIVTAIASMDQDHALMEALASRLRSNAPNLCSKLQLRRKLSSRDTPHVASIVAAQCSVFDNWIEHGGRKPKRGEAGHYADRFKIIFDFWTWTSADLDWSNPTYRGTAHLWTSGDIKRRSNGKSNMRLPKALGEEFREAVVGQAENIEGFRIGLPYTRDGKTILYNTDETLIVAREEELQQHALSSIIVRLNTGDFIFTDFRTTTSKGNSLDGNCFAHSRMTTKPALAAKWNATLIPDQPAARRREG